jgi:hypothetical protein
MRGARAQPMIQVHEGEARLYRDRIEVGDIGGEVKVFPLKETTAANTFKQQKIRVPVRKGSISIPFSQPSNIRIQVGDCLQGTPGNSREPR